MKATHTCEGCGGDADKKIVVKTRDKFYQQFWVCSSKCEIEVQKQKVAA